jgi:hypothetical protein
MSYDTSTALRKSSSEIVACSTGCCVADWRRYWAIESVRCGSDWQSLISTHLDIADLLRRVSS